MQEAINVETPRCSTVSTKTRREIALTAKGGKACSPVPVHVHTPQHLLQPRVRTACAHTPTHLQPKNTIYTHIFTLSTLVDRPRNYRLQTVTQFKVCPSWTEIRQLDIHVDTRDGKPRGSRVVASGRLSLSRKT
eukprot:1887073-Pyramimonas_sp.AAC.1